MFDQTFVNTQAQVRRPWTMAVSLAFQIGLTATLLLIPLLHPEVLLLKPQVSIPSPIRQVTKLSPEPVKIYGTESMMRHLPRPFMAPPRILDHVSNVADAFVPGEPLTVVGPGLPMMGSFPGIPGMTGAPPMTALPAPPPIPVRKPDPPRGPMHVSSGVQSALLIFGPKPVYPALAKAARVQGTVRIQAVIAKDGSIQGLSVVSGPPLLIPVAIEAVKQWRYHPTLLNGEPVEVATEIDVNFTLAQ